MPFLVPGGAKVPTSPAERRAGSRSGGGAPAASGLKGARLARAVGAGAPRSGRQAARQHTPGRPALGVRAAHPSRAGQRLHRCSGARAGGLAVRGRQLGGALPADRRSGGCLLLCQEEAPLQALMGEMSNIRAAGRAWRESSASCCQRKGVSAVTDAESCGVMGTLSSLAVRSTCRSAGSRIAHWRYPRCRNVPGGWPDSVTSSHEKRPADSSFVIL